MIVYQVYDARGKQVDTNVGPAYLEALEREMRAGGEGAGWTAVALNWGRECDRKLTFSGWVRL